MMMRVENSVAAALLSSDRYKFLAELASLAIENPYVPKEAYADGTPATVVMIVEHFPHGDTATFSSCDAAFIRAAVAQTLSRIGSFLLTSPDRHVFEAPEIASAFEVGEIRCMRSFVCTSLDRVPHVSRPAAALAETDREAFVNYGLADGAWSPRRADLFRWLVTEGGGEVLTVKDGDEIVGYLSCNPLYENIWDVEFIHVRQAARRRGVGTVLACSYATRRLTQGQVPYWSAAANEVSERTALRAGFLCCRDLFYVEVTLRPGLEKMS